MLRSTPSIIRPVVNKPWIEKFLSRFKDFTAQPNNKNIQANLQPLGYVGITLFRWDETPSTPAAENPGALLLQRIRKPSHTIKTARGHLLKTPHGLDLTMMLEYDPVLRREFATARHLARIAGLGRPAKTPPSAYGIVLGRFEPETISQEQQLSLLALTDTIRPPYVILGEAQPFRGHA